MPTRSKSTQAVGRLRHWQVTSSSSYSTAPRNLIYGGFFGPMVIGGPTHMKRYAHLCNTPAIRWPSHIAFCDITEQTHRPGWIVPGHHAGVEANGSRQKWGRRAVVAGLQKKAGRLSLDQIYQISPRTRLSGVTKLHKIPAHVSKKSGVFPAHQGA